MGPEVGKYVKAVYNFTAQQTGELTLQDGDIVKVTDVVDGNWLQGEAIYGASGSFPSNFVEPLILPDVRMGQRVFVALADFPADQSGDLELTKGDIILGTEQVDDNWWKGKNGPLRGIFPLSCVHELDVCTVGPRSRSASLRNRSASLKSRSNSLAKTSETVFARALVDVVPQIEGELGFQTGDLITVKEVVDEDWFYGECHNSVGLVSTICVEFLDDSAEDSEPSSVQESPIQSDIYTERRINNNAGGGERNSPYEKSQDEQEVPVRSRSAEIESERHVPQQSVSYTSENTEITPYAKTLYPFQAQLPTELSFGENEIVTLIQHVDEDWIEGELDGKIGIFPSSFVEIIVDCPYAYNTSTADSGTGSEENTVASEASKSIEESYDVERAEVKVGEEEQRISQNGHSEEVISQVDSQTSTPEDKNKKGYPQNSHAAGDSSLALVLHSFQGEVDGDLTVKEGDTIEVLRIMDNDWLEARDDHGITGLVPKNHVEVIGSAPQRLSKKSKTVCGEGNVSAEKVQASGLESVQTSSSDEQCSNVQSVTSSSNQGILTSSVFSATPEDSMHAGPGQQLDQQGPVGHHQIPHHRPPVLSKPTPLPKPKLAPKPVIKPKPFSSPKSYTSPAHGIPEESAVTHVSSPTGKRAFHNASTGDGRGSSPKDKIFSGINSGLSLNNLVQVELEKAKSDGVRSCGSSVIEEEKHSRSGSFSSIVSDDRPAVSVALDSQRTISDPHSVKSNFERMEETSSSQAAASSTNFAVNFSFDDPENISAAYNATTISGVNGTQTLSSSDLHTLLPPSSQLNRSASDSRMPGADAERKAPLTPKSKHRHSLPPARPVPPPPKHHSKRHSFVNPGFEHESEGHLISVDATNLSRPPPPNRTLPRPQPLASTPSTDVDLLGSVEKRVKRPPPRPTGPRVASVPSKTPMQPVRADGAKPIPNRPAPTAPGVRRSAPVAPESIPRPPGVEPPSTVPPRPASLAGGATPPKRPPPRLQRTPHDLMRFSPEPVIDEAEDSTELIADLKKRLQENRNDIQKYEQSRQELEAKLLGLEEGEERSETTDSLHFVKDTLQGLRDEEKRLKGNLFHVSPREEKLEKAKLLAEQRATDEQLRREEEEKSAAQERTKRREKRKRVLQELVETEKDFLFDLHLCLTTFFDCDSAVKPPSCVDVEFLFGNMEEIADVSQRLLTSLESATSGKAFSDQIVGSTFVALAEDMKNTYAPYCRHHDDAIAVMEKYHDIPEACQYFAAKVEEMRRRTNIFDIEAILIKPVQRILKYPLLLHELLKCTEDEHPDKTAITNAMRAMTDVATAINEYKRRKDLAFKYKRDSDQTFTMKIAKLNFHSIKKKSSRMRGRLTTNLGIGLQLRDENFEYEEARFRSAEKAVKILLRNVMSYLDGLQEVITCQENLAADISDYYGEKTCQEATRYLTVHRTLLSHYKTLTDTVEALVIIPLNKLVAMLNGPNNVIDKRFDKLLDYNNLLGRDKDEKLVQAAKKDYEALNAQLLDELPSLYQLIMTLMKHCMAAYIRSQRDFMDHALKENCILLELPSLLGGGENVMEYFNIRHTAALDQISMLSFIPRGFNPKVDSFRLDRRGSSRQSFDPSKPPPMVQSCSQSESQRSYLRQMYGGDSLYQVTQTMATQDLMDMAVTVGTLVAVIKDKDPMGGRQRWFVDDGVNKGFVQSSILTKAGTSSPSGSLSSLITDEMDEIASECSTGTEDTESLPWLTGSQSAPVYPELTEVSQAASSPPGSKSSEREYYTAEYPFTARSSNEVSLQPGQVVLVLSQHDLDGNSEWWLVDAEGDTGYAPANYLRKL
ncbi:dynamin-binding protein-like [Littorina saxatilis]|uniref:dynamin-binding protein-like n=1 Tax=Littorina saxatilis TaxID=31220 RepID=UPI0038B574D6